MAQRRQASSHVFLSRVVRAQGKMGEPLSAPRLVYRSPSIIPVSLPVEVEEVVVVGQIPQLRPEAVEVAGPVSVLVQVVMPEDFMFRGPVVQRSIIMVQRLVSQDQQQPEAPGEVAEPLAIPEQMVVEGHNPGIQPQVPVVVWPVKPSQEEAL